MEEKNTQAEATTEQEQGGGPEVVPEGRVALKRQIGPFGSMAFALGTIVGSGIFVSPQGVLRNSGSLGLCLVIWGLGGVMAAIGSLVYCELTCLVARSGAEYAFYREGLGHAPAFLFVWVYALASFPGGAAVKTITCAAYVIPLFEMCGVPSLVSKLFAITLLVTLVLINSWSAHMSSNVQVIFTSLKLIALVIIIVVGIVQLAKGEAVEWRGFEGTTTSVSEIVTAIYYISFAYGGCQSVATLIEEVENTARNAMISILGSVAIVTVLYVLTNVSYLAVLTLPEMLASQAVALDWGNKVLGSFAIVIPISVFISTFGSAQASMYKASRLTYAAGRDGNIPEFMSYVSVSLHTPVLAIVFQGVLAVVMVIGGDVGSLISLLSFMDWLFNGMSALCLLVLRYTRKDEPRRFKAPLLAPVLYLLMSVFLVVAPLVTNPRLEIVFAATFVVGGLLLFLPLKYCRPRVLYSLTDAVSVFLQVSTASAPSMFVPEKQK